MRHDNVPNLLAEKMKEVYRDVEVEPPLTPLNGEVLQPRSANSDDEARSDIRVNGFWTRQQSAYFDVRIFYPQAPSYRARTLDELLKRFETDKKGNTATASFRWSEEPSLPLSFLVPVPWERKRQELAKSWHPVWQTTGGKNIQPSWACFAASSRSR